MFAVGATAAVEAGVCPKMEPFVPPTLKVDAEEVEGTLEAPKLNPVEGAVPVAPAPNEKPVVGAAGADAPNIDGAGAAGAALDAAGWLNEGTAADVPNENDGAAADAELPNIDGTVDAVLVAAPKTEGVVDAVGAAAVVDPKRDGCAGAAT